MTARKKTPAEVVASFDAIVAELDVPDPLPFNANITVECPTGEQLLALNDATQADDVRALRAAIFGDAVDEANEAFAKAPFKAWNAWFAAYMKHFFGDDDAGKS